MAVNLRINRTSFFVLKSEDVFLKILIPLLLYTL